MILVAGSANLDFVVRAPHIPAPGETVLGHDFKIFPGGKGANQALACARAGGVETEMLLALGEDAFAAPLVESMQSAGVRMHTHRVRDQATGTAFVCVSCTGENAITVAPGANGSLRSEHLPALEGVTHLLMQLEIPLDTVMSYARAAKSRDVAVVLNAAPAQALSAALLAMTDVLIVNEGELAALAGKHDSIADRIARIDTATVVVTLGKEGCLARADGEFFTQPGFTVEAVDTTAAGDTFCGVLVASLSKNLHLREAMARACAAGAIACTRAGAQASIPTHAEIDDFLRARPVAPEVQHENLRQLCGLPTSSILTSRK